MPKHALVPLPKLNKIAGPWIALPIALSTPAAFARDQTPPPEGDQRTPAQAANTHQANDAAYPTDPTPTQTTTVGSATVEPASSDHAATQPKPTSEEPPAMTEPGANPQVHLVTPPQPVGPRDEASTAHGSAPARSGFRSSLAVTAGYAAPSGNMIKGIELSDAITSAIPLGLDFRVLSQSGLALGLYLQFAPGFSGQGNDCDSCASYGGRIGLQVGQHFAPTSLVDPWLMAGVGYEFVTMSEDTEVLAVTDAGGLALLDGTRSLTTSSLPELMLQVGLDFGTERLRVGPYAFASWGRYGKLTEEVTCDDPACSGTEVSEADSDISSSQRSNHYWLGGGIRVSLNR